MLEIYIKTWKVHSRRKSKQINAFMLVKKKKNANSDRNEKWVELLSGLKLTYRLFMASQYVWVQEVFWAF